MTWAETFLKLFTLSVNIIWQVFRLVNHNGLKTFTVGKSTRQAVSPVFKRLSGLRVKNIREQIRILIVDCVENVHLD
jgi:hypothetical protein